MADKIIELENHFCKTPEEMLAVAGRADIQQAVIIFFDSDGLVNTITTDMVNKDLLWMLEIIKNRILNP